MVKLRQFDVVANPSRLSRERRPYLVVVQNDLLDTTDTVVVAPLALEARLPPIPRLKPALRVDGKSVVLNITEISHVLRTALGKPIANLRADRDSFTAAIDTLISGV